MNLDPHENVRAQCDAAMRAYLEGGGTIQRLPVGAMAATGWKSEDYDPSSQKAKQRSMRNRKIAREERAARVAAEKVARGSAPLPKVVKERKPRVRKPKPRKVRLRNGPEPNRPGTLQHEAWEALAAPMTARKLADLKGWGINTTMQRLTRLREMGLVESKGSKGNMRWGRA